MTSSCGLMLKVEALIRVAPISAHQSRPLSSNTGDKKGRSALWDLLQHHPDLPTGAECPQLPSESVQSTIFSFLESNLIYWVFFSPPRHTPPKRCCVTAPSTGSFFPAQNQARLWLALERKTSLQDSAFLFF